MKLKTKIVTKFKDSNCNETQKTQIVTKLQNWNCDKTRIVINIQLWQNSNCDKFKLLKKSSGDKNKILRKLIRCSLVSVLQFLQCFLFIFVSHLEKWLVQLLVMSPVLDKSCYVYK